MDRKTFSQTLNNYLLPSSPIRREELLKGRAQQLQQIDRALASPGRNVFIFGDRGVGKTSLALTAAYIHQSSDSEPVLVGSDRTSTCFKISQLMSSKLLRENPLIAKSIMTTTASANWKFISGEVKSAIEEGRIPVPTSIDEAVNLIKFSASMHSITPAVIIDEFDRIENPQERALFGDLIKQIGDQEVEVKLIFSGVGSSLTELLAEHESCYRYLSSVRLERLKMEPRIEIIEQAAAALEIEISRDYLVRIALISDGFPHYVHLIGSKLFWEVYDDNKTKVQSRHFTAAIRESVREVEPHLKTMYDKATQKYNDEYKYVLWAVADHPDLIRRSSDIYDSYCRIMTQLQAVPIDRSKFNNRINALKGKSHGEILKANRQGWYEFQEPVLRGYCRLLAEEKNVMLDRDYYLGESKKGTNRN